jgi:hypothetical protein
MVLFIRSFWTKYVQGLAQVGLTTEAPRRRLHKTFRGRSDLPRQAPDLDTYLKYCPRIVEQSTRLSSQFCGLNLDIDRAEQVAATLQRLVKP